MSLIGTCTLAILGLKQVPLLLFLVQIIKRPMDNKKKFNNVRNPNLVCTNCNMTSHTIERCFELISYPPNFMKKSNTGQNVSNVSGTGKSADASGSVSHTLTSDQYQKLMSLLSDSGPSSTSSQSNMAVPGYHVSLLSVSRLAKDNKFSVLGHPADQVLSVLKNDIDLKGDYTSEPFDVCHRAKQTREPFPLSDHKSTTVGQLIHLDVWGPYKVRSKEDNLNFFDVQRPNNPDDDVRDSSEGGGTNPFFVEPALGSDKTDLSPIADPSASTSNQSPDKSSTVSTQDVSTEMLGSITEQGSTEVGGATFDDDIYISEGDNLDLYNLDMLFKSNEGNGKQSSAGGPRRSNRKYVLPNQYNDYVMNKKAKHGLDKVVTYSNLSSDNYSFVTNLNRTTEPKSYKEAAFDPRWVEAMNAEIESLIRNMTWVVTELPKNRKVIGCKWIFKIKYKSTGEVKRHKARIMAKGFSQREGVDYEETFSPVVKMATVRCLLSLAVQKGWVYQLDINNAFLYGEIVEDVYMTLPEGYFGANDNRVCKLQNSLYGLKQAPRKWHEKLTSVLKMFGFEQSKNDFSLYTKSAGECFVVLLVYVDDILITGNDLTEINNNKVVKAVDGDDKLLDNISNYQKLIGKLIYLTTTRPDIPYVVHKLSQVMHSAKQSDLRLAFKVLRYLKGSPGKGVLYSESNMFSVSAYVDSDWAKSSAEAEFKAMSTVTCEIMWVLKILTELKVKYHIPVSLFCDSSSTIQIATNPVFHERTKHFEIDLFSLGEKIADGIIKTCKVKSEENVANILIKGLSVNDHRKLCGMLKLFDSFQGLFLLTLGSSSWRL
ncbi:putative RNA-directed DNA polymerase [Tanacetum coccineum]